MNREEIKDKILELAREYCALADSDKAGRKYIPASGKVLGAPELVNMIEASLDMWLTAGRYNDAFESKFAGAVGAKFALSANSGSSANLLALSALCSPALGDKKMSAGDEVITAAAGFPTTVNPIIQNSLVPVFVDSELPSCNIDAGKIEAAITPKTKAVFVAHTLGNPFDLERISGICKKHGLWLIEDCCDALGAKFAGRPVGSFGDISTYSFYPAHHITMGEGGAVATNDLRLRKILLSLRDWGRDCWCPPGRDNTCKRRFNMKLGRLPDGYDHKYTYSHIGYNLKITDWQAAIGLAQIDRLPDFLLRRRQNAEFLLGELAGLEDKLILPRPNPATLPSWFGFLISVRAGAGFTKRELVEYLEANGVGTRQLFAGNILRQPMLTDMRVKIRIGDSPELYSSELKESDYAMLPNADFIMNNTFWIGCFPGIGREDLLRSAGLIKEFCRGRR